MLHAEITMGEDGSAAHTSTRANTQALPIVNDTIVRSRPSYIVLCVYDDSCSLNQRPDMTNQNTNCHSESERSVTKFSIAPPQLDAHVGTAANAPHLHPPACSAVHHVSDHDTPQRMLTKSLRIFNTSRESIRAHLTSICCNTSRRDDDEEGQTHMHSSKPVTARMNPKPLEDARTDEPDEDVLT